MAHASELPAEVDVLVVGAGPTGLLLTIALRRLGIDAHLIDRNSAPLTWDRATVITARSLEILDQLGLVDPIVDRGVHIREIVVAVDGTLLDAADAGQPGATYPYNVGLAEDELERVLRTDLARHGSVVYWGASLHQLTQGADGVEAVLVGERGPAMVRARWLVGCDGFHGATRHAAGIDRCRVHPDREWAVFDATVQPWTSPIEATYAYLDGPGAILTPLPDRRWRVYTRPAPDTDAVAETLSVLQRYHSTAQFADVAHLSHFTCHSMIAAEYRRDRVFLAGDAAHVCSPAQGQGMNIGLHDAHNLSWKLAMVLHEAADDGLLDSYAAERRPIGEAVIDAGDSADRVEDGRGRADDSQRRRELERLLTVDDERTWTIDYPNSPIVLDRGGAGVPPGAIAPQSWSSNDLRHRAVVSASPNFADRQLPHLRSAADAFGWSPPMCTAPNGALDPPTVHVVRPDGYVGLRADLGDDAALDEYVAVESGSAG
ncbi:MAG: FAD-dependent monooxygenase [Actinomycetota bacterium]